ncbi:MAG: tRNA (adenosine(37)-N6)-threonylcarbamoyltransferase complex dimerization subunit type 1 TsaB [Prevotellaceae bacterium]|nr:tRNA (adenosine(37)-N6)-threonylcarbamoyltransferase complex dimerization subunit type 1 TsaB [Prevotellaceae bacterium]MDY3855581.1 tRNA (adenosine(37)-N6)-threonylcarbamoyltransferase complex dimerization subunit type 1 TsaB [Bacteroidaceae bacterium]
MPCIVHIETATDVCSVALSQDGKVLTSEENYDGPNHNVVLGPLVNEVVSFANSHAIPIDAVAVSSGPGSYTGLRIGVSTAKGLCYGRNLKLISISTLELLCVPILLYHEEIPDDALLCPMIDARRMEVYAGIYDRALRPVRTVAADIVTPETYAEYLEQHPVVFIGNGAAKCKDTIRHPNAIFIEGIHPLAKNMLPLAEKALAADKTEDVAYFEPFYLKDFVATKPKKLF